MLREHIWNSMIITVRQDAPELIKKIYKRIVIKAEGDYSTKRMTWFWWPHWEKWTRCMNSRSTRICPSLRPILRKVSLLILILTSAFGHFGKPWKSSRAMYSWIGVNIDWELKNSLFLFVRAYQSLAQNVLYSGKKNKPTFIIVQGGILAIWKHVV